ncbi:MAG: hypothetical protein M3454_04010 [Actinomycetota bacterium]|nr:hypothetical protein [Actinomycetota bacterium]
MKLYAQTPRMRNAQILRDLLTLAWVGMWVWVGTRVHDLVAALAGPGRAVESAGQDLSRSADEAGSGISDLPVVGDALEGPFGALSGVGRSLQGAGAAQQEAIAELALWLGTSLALIPIALVVLRYLPGRLSWIREATAADRIRLDADDLELFALRAAVTRPFHELRQVSKDPAGDLATGNYQALARLELTALGLSDSRVTRPEAPSRAPEP